MDKKNWLTPRLTVLLRDSKNSVLRSCKTGAYAPTYHYDAWNCYATWYPTTWVCDTGDAGHCLAVTVSCGVNPDGYPRSWCEVPCSDPRAVYKTCPTKLLGSS